MKCGKHNVMDTIQQFDKCMLSVQSIAFLHVYVIDILVRGWPKSAQRVPNREPGSLKLIPYREPRSLEISQTGTYQEPGTEPRSSGLNFLGQPRSNWFYREVTVFLQEFTGFWREFTGFYQEVLPHSTSTSISTKVECRFNFVFFLTTHLPTRNNNETPNSTSILILTGFRILIWSI